MAVGSQIEWTEATWNPTTGCTEISPGCKNCYAKKLSKRLNAMRVRKYRNNFKFTEHPKDLELPLTWKKPKKIFVNSMSDLFHEKSRMEFIASCFNTMINANWHIYQVLTKRPHAMIEFSRLFESYFGETIPQHIWMGTSVENEDYSWRIDELKKVRCTVRFLSIEPLIGPIGSINLDGIDWVIIGGESGPGHRDVKKEWIKDIIRQCKRQKTAVFFKQWGGSTPKSGGRRINGRIYDEYPRIKRTKHTLDSTKFDKSSFIRIMQNSSVKKLVHV